MKKIALLLHFSFLAQLCFAQSQMPLTIREIYDFSIGDIFIYKQNVYNLILRQSDTIYERQTILKKLSQTQDSIVYILKKESAYISSFNKVSVKIDTLVVKDLDSLAVYKIKDTNPRVISKDIYTTLFNSNRKTNVRELGGLTDYCVYFEVGQGIGIVQTYRCSFTPDDLRLIYFKKGTEIWGTSINFSTSLFTAPLFDTKIKLYPNPTHEVLQIETNLPVFQVKIVNVNGQMLLKGTNLSQINTTQLPNGIYFLHVFEGKILRGVKKFIVNH